MSLAAVICSLMMLESSVNPAAVGDNGKAIGVLQIHACVVQDVNRKYHTQYQWPADCRDVTKSREICRLYLQMYMKPGMSAEQVARTWNGGPAGARRQATLAYGARFTRIHANPTTQKTVSARLAKQNKGGK